MGLQNQVNDISTNSLPIILLMFIAEGVSYLQRLLLAILRFIGLSRFFPADDDLLVGVGVVAEQLNLNKKFSYSYNINSRVDREGGGGAAADCIVCLNRLRNGDRVRRLVCRHVFHKECFDGWLNHLNFNCPLCRSPVVSGKRVAIRGGA